MRTMGTTLVLALTLLTPGFAQQGTAPNGYYPREYQGMIFTGEVIDGPLDVVTLRYKKADREETFIGRFESPCAVPTKDGKMGAMAPSDVPLGDVVTAYYYGRAVKTNGKSVKENVIIGIVFDAVNGKAIPAEKRKAYQCTQQWTAVYKAFGGDGAITSAPGPYQK